MKELLTRLVNAYGPSGREQAISRVIADLAAPFGEIFSDPLGNLIVHRPGRGRRVLVASHMDSLGLAVTYIEKEGFARFGALGGLQAAQLPGTRIRFENGTTGIVQKDASADLSELKITDLFIDTMGQQIFPGDVAIFDNTPRFSGDFVCGPSLDNRIGCAVALRTLHLCAEHEKNTNDLYFVFTVQEEVGIRGAKTAAYAIDPQLAIAVDVCGAGDQPGSTIRADVSLGGGPVVMYMDKSTICHRSVVDALFAAGRSLEISCQGFAAAGGGTDAAVIHQTRSGVPTGILSIPTRYIHSPNELCCLSDAQACAQVLAAAIEAYEA